MYARSNPSADSQHSLRFCADFLREFCVTMEGHSASEKLIADLQSGERVILPKTKAHAQAMLRVAFAVLGDLEKVNPPNPS